MKFAIKLCLWALAFVPLIVDHSVFYPETTGKNLFIEVILVIIGILFTVNLFYSRDFREEIWLKLTKYLKNPIFLAVLAFILVFIISAIFAVDKYSAFWGSAERAEGLVGMAFFFAFFIFTLLVFERKDWLWFLRLSLFTSLILLSKQFIDLSGGLSRSGSFTGNPTYLSGYLLFSITSSLILMSEDKNRFFRYFSGTIIILSVIGIFMAQTRGTILGLGLGLVSVLIFCVLIGKGINYKKLNLRVTALTLLCLGIIFSGVFIFTRQNVVWQNIPGLSRLASLGQGERGDSTASRILTLQSGWDSIRPTQNGWKKTLIGWGPDNFILAYGRNYNPEQYKIELAWFDRAHNKFLDVWVMSGLFGLITYLVIWFTFFKFLFKKGTPQNLNEVTLLTRIGLLFFGASFLVHLLFIFDQISTSIPLFALLSFVAYLRTDLAIQKSKTLQLEAKSGKMIHNILAGVSIILTVFLGFIFCKNTIPSYFQIRSFAALIKEADAVTIENKVDPVLTPFTSAQIDVRRVLLMVSNDIYNQKPKEDSARLLEKSLIVGEEYVVKRSSDFKFFGSLANVYSNAGFKFGNPEYLKRGEVLYLRMLDFVPDRPDVIYGLAVNLVQQERYQESFSHFEATFSHTPVVLNKDKEKFEAVYTRLVKYFYEQRDKDKFIKVVSRLKKNNYANSALLDQILDYLNSTGNWPRVDFK